MTSRAKLFKNGGSQAVRLPKDCRFPEDQREVAIHREGHRIVLEPFDGWPEEFLACIGAWESDIPRPQQEPAHPARDPFER